MHHYIQKSLILVFAIFIMGVAIPPATATPPAEKEYVSIDFDGVDIRVFIKFISELTQENFIIDNKVKGKVSIISPGQISIEEAQRVFESVLEVHGFTTIKSGEVTKIIPLATARVKSMETLTGKEEGRAEDKIITQVIPLGYADSDLMKKVLSPMISKGCALLSYGPTNTLVITDVYSNIKRLMKIINVIDVKDVGRQITVLPLQFAEAEKLVKTLETLFKERKRKKADPNQQCRFVAEERTNAIILLANEFDTNKVRTLVKTMDQDVPKSDAKIRVIYLENAKAEDLATVLQSLSDKNSQQKKSGKKTSPVVSDTVKITHDNATNSLIIMADREDYEVLKEIVKKLDIPRPMVYIEALIMEIRDTDDFAVGVEWTMGTSAGDIDGRDAGTFGGFISPEKKGVKALPTVDANGNVLLPGGFSVGVMTEALKIGGLTLPNIGAAIKAVRTNENVRILSTPQILTTDNEEAEISVGENIPYLTSSSSGDSNYSKYEYKDVGVSLKITPQISQGRFVRLNIFQKVEKLTSISNVDENAATPTTLKRTAETTVVVKDASTVVIGGLIGEDMNTGGNKVPCLGDIPLLGHLFRSKTTNGIKTNLYIFLTPRIIENPREANRIYRQKKDHMNTISETHIPLYKKGAPGKDDPKNEH